MSRKSQVKFAQTPGIRRFIKRCSARLQRRTAKIMDRIREDYVPQYNRYRGWAD